MRGLPPVVILVILVAGCAAEGGTTGTPLGPGGSSNGPPAPASTSVAPPIDPDPAKGFGAIDGMVTDDELVPLPGVLIQVHPRDTPDQNLVELRSDDLGAFRVDGLVEGPYTLYANRPGYEVIKPRTVDIRPDETTVVKVQLKKLPSLEPNHDTQTFYWQPDYAYAYRVGEGGGASSGGSGTIMVNQSADGDLRSIIVESVWQDSGICTANMRTIVFSPDNFAKMPRTGAAEGEANPFYWDNLPNVTKPTHLFIPREGSGREAITSSARRVQNMGLELRIDGPWIFNTRLEAKDFMGQSTVKFSCAMGIKIETWATVFYKQDAPMRMWSVFPKT